MYWSIAGIPKSGSESKRNNLIYIQRTAKNAMNSARLILNEEPFIQVLRDYCSKHSLNYVQYDHSKDDGHIRSRIELFYNAQIIIGVHSGALSNMNFAQAGTTIIEIMPYRADSSPLPMTCSMFRAENIKACAGYILYTQAQLLNQSYWILPFAVNLEGNMNVDTTRLQKLLDQI
jgi:capsular polysaccharide biosynthesis protein